MEAILISAVVGVIAWFIGRANGALPYRQSVNRVTAKLRQGQTEGWEGAPAEIQALLGALRDRQLAAPAQARPEPAEARPRRSVPESGPNLASPATSAAAASESPDQAALWAALSRVSRHLKEQVEQPLANASSGDPTSLREGVGQALGALEDIDFFLAPTPQGTEDFDLGDAVSEVLRVFESETGTRAKQRGPRRPIGVQGNLEGFKDSLFLVLHNAAQFGGGSPIDVVVRLADGLGRVHVRDRGPGFTAEALSRAYDPFYTTVEGNLGLGLAHARRLVEESGGKIHLTNAERGGGEVEIGLQSTNPRSENRT